MCKWLTRVHSCGHYTKTIQEPCNDAKKIKKVCDYGSEESKTTGGLCYLPGCDKKPGVRREGPGKRYQRSPNHSANELKQTIAQMVALIRTMLFFEI